MRAVLTTTPTVRRWLVALVSVAVMPTLVAATAALLYAYKEERATFRGSLQNTTRSLALFTDREILRRETIALTLAGSPTLTRGDLKGFYEYATQIAPTRDKVVVLHALDGQQLVNTRLPFGAALPKSQISAERHAAGPLATLVSNVYFAPVGGDYSFAVQVPVVREGRPIYYLSLAGYASAMRSILDDQRLPAGWRAAIIDARGVVVARNLDAERYIGQPVNPALASKLKDSREGTFESTGMDGAPILASFSQSPGYGWTVFVGVPMSATGAPLRVVAGFAGLAVLLLALSFLAAVVVGRRLLLPVQRLTAASHALGSGAPLDPSPTGLVETDRVLAAMREANDRVVRANQALEARRHDAEAAADELRSSNERVQLASETSGLGLFTWLPEQDIVTWHNDRPYQIFGIAPADPPLTAARFATEFLHPEDAGAVAASLEQTAKDGAPLHFQCRFRRADGELRWLELTGHRRPLRPDEPTVIVGTAADVTERRQANQALRQSEERLRQLANTIPNLTWMADPDGSITWYNDRWYEYTGTTPEQMVGWGWQSVHDPARLGEVVERWTLSIRTGQPFEMPFVPLRGKDGVFRPFFTRVMPLRDTAGTIVQWFGTNTDVSTLKKAEEDLREADRRKDEFLAMLAHELRNPLAPIRTAAELLRKLPSPEPSVARASEIIVRQVSHMTGLLNDLLEVSRISRGLLTLDRERVTLASVISAAIEQVRPLIEAKQHTLTVEQGDARAEVMASPCG